MKIGPKFKIARRLQAPIFEKTQTAKFKANSEKKGKLGGRRPRPKSDYGNQLMEKQKARFTYGISERQFSNYVNKVITRKSTITPQEKLFEELERRLDNVVYRLGLAKTRQAARQMVSHGHIMVNGRRVDIPSIQVSKGDKISVREASLAKLLFANLEINENSPLSPTWLKFDFTKKAGTVEAMPTIGGQSLLFDLSAVLEFYKR